MKPSSFHGKLGPSDESTAEISLSSLSTDTADLLSYYDRFNTSLDMDTHNRTGAAISSLSRHSLTANSSHHRRDQQRRLEAIDDSSDNNDEYDRVNLLLLNSRGDIDEDDENFLQDSFAVDDGNSLITQAITGASATFLMGDNYISVSDVEEEETDAEQEVSTTVV
mmetsp:Transcript_8294/g.10868  ORF Transcript_8294/g.10868 Transcript_8294/m.10868 type:complete len:166 (+) Transcript_8294:134-631(+)|eukprot:CAMPEP_0198146484 /NCGR_PEP_ID=MMETSP1443-20131203/29607_1 /TAXON_ID=186043 /ORGANISM="Entomoneis sp., Strain CCMP2396" /LENGTH=165 /DNA_ID=CAMNT_0043810469 /DNA_START=127 /DNA_END=624 /DNA_ORIENTATION=+